MTLLEAELEALDPDLVRNDLAAVLYRRVTGRYEIDEWGLDADLVGLLAPLARLRWCIRTEGESAVPEIGPALLVHTRRLGVSEPSVLASAVRRSTGRNVRVFGGPDWGPLSGPARKLGMVPAHTADLRGLLRSGEVASLALAREPVHPYHVPPVPVAPIAQALEAGAPIVPVAVLGVEPARRWTVRFGAPVVTRRRSATGDPTELAEAVRARLQQLLTRARPR
jgi:hypothetical protein